MRLSQCFPVMAVAAAFAFAPTPTGAESTYGRPPEQVLEVLRATPPPSASLSPANEHLLLATPVRYPPIADLARPFLRLAGVRFVPENRAAQGAFYWRDYTLTTVATGAQTKVNLPAGAKVGWPSWSADGKRYAFSIITDASVELWVGDVSSAVARRIEGARLNPILGDELQWLPDQRTLLVKLVPASMATPLGGQATPLGPNVQEAHGEKGPSSTYEVRDVLQSPQDEDRFDYYATTQLARVDFASGAITPLGKPAIYTSLAPAPGGKHLLVQSIHRPYSYITTYDNFPTEVNVWDEAGNLVHKVASLPLADAVPIWGVPTGPREFAWRATDPATLVWAEALDGGDWKTEVPHRDRVMIDKAPFDRKPVELTLTELRFSGFWWGERPDLAFLTEYDAIKHWTRTYTMDVDRPDAAKRLLWDRSTDEAYKHPGYPVLRVLANGASVVQQDGDAVHLTFRGSSPQGDRPFLDRLDLKRSKTERLFRSGKTEYESFLGWVDVARKQFVTRHESPTEPPNFFVRTLRKRVTGAAADEAAFSSSTQAITHLTDPTPEVRGITKQLVKYRRADGVDLSFTLYLPPGYKQGTRLPTVLWAYPLDYTDPQMAGQVVGSTQRFTILGWPLQLFFLLDGYAVIDNPSLPVVGDTNKIYDTYMEQLVAGATAAVDKAVELGVTDPDRIGVTGHSHGGLMTVNLLAHSDLFRAGIARSGAYNRSLTAFGFQNERRTLWEATDVYVKVSPFFHADKIKSPLLLIHGETDANPGTTPLQSEKLFEAVRGNGGTVRLVMLPFESHGYRAMESTEHVLQEMLAWFDRYVKHAPPRASRPE